MALRQKPEDGSTLSQISQVLRRYFIAAFQLPAGESTTAEFCRLLSADERFAGGLASAVTEFLQRCDEQKFSPAKSPARLDAAERALAMIDQAEARRVSSNPRP
ncbi:MAG: hypothetical protein U1F65_10710 [Verrucomicrobiota bacterium]